MIRRSVLGCAVAAALLTSFSPEAPAAAALRVCADPNNLPFSNERLEGFENRLAELVARELDLAGVRYTWWAQRRGFFRNTLNAGLCDVVMGVPRNIALAATTEPYYRSSYAFVTRKDRRLELRSIDDPVLRHQRIGVPLIGDDGASSPPAHALSRRGITNNVTGYSVYGDYSTESPPSRIVSAVARGEIDVAIAWGPLAGFFAARQSVPLEIRPVSPPSDLAFLPFAFDISMAVRRGDTARRNQLNRIIAGRRRDIDALLAEYHVPRVGTAAEVVR